MSEHLPGIVILASGSGSTAEAFIHATQDGQVEAEVGLVICNNPPEVVGIYSRIARLNVHYGLDIETAEISGRTHPGGKVGRGQTLAESAAICEKVSRGGFAHVALMGYMKVVRGDLMEQYGWRSELNSIYEAKMTNTHPGPLPETADMIGIHASEKVLASGMSSSKHTVHLVAPGVDAGPILSEHSVAVLGNDTADSLFSRVQAKEKLMLPYAIGAFLYEQGVFFDNL